MLIYLYPLFPIAGGLLATFFIYMLGFRKFNTKDMLIGLAILLICLAIQILTPLQQALLIPIVLEVRQEALARNITDPNVLNRMIIEKIYSLGTLFIVGISFWSGFIAGVIQESLKYLWIRKSTYFKALGIGLGFGVAEAFIVPLLAFQAHLQNLSTASISIFVAFAALSLYERFAVALFHTGIALFMLDMFRRGRGLVGLSTAIAIHGLIDGFAMLYQYLGRLELLAVTEVLVIIAGLATLLKLYRKALEELQKVETKIIQV